ncbi:O-antigen ligase family protein [Polaribacter undariae]|uniref:O-antigen ligase family protein n=1 Tax=Polaribacter sejongensis TaxID=985043 RepID=A0AAJ1VG69_9FLAO|nr:O-antigen ligase family protein [Polaribacter undariae]MDN3618929.1 O-antigen ligase family protein [Polaribacter undariae]UWD33018.1 O-antigen ligase family protein [Polaribacter undariae]
MVQYILNNKLKLIGIHILIGFLGTLPVFPKIYGVVCLVLPILLIYSSKNRNEEAFLFASYLVGGEIFLRMIGGTILYETGKYGVALFLLLGIFLGPFKQKFSVHFIFYILLLLLGIVFTQVPEGESLRKNIVFNLSGPIVLGICALYFYYRHIPKQVLVNALFFMLLPLFSMITYLYFRTPDLKEIVFGSAANFETSGGFGPNQVATAIGLGIVIIVVFLLLKEKLTGYIFLDAFFLIYFVYRGLLTFSRGGIFTAVIALLLFSFFFILYKKISFQILFKYLLIIGFFIFSIWLYTSNVTGGMIDNRYANKNARGIEKKDISTGRIDILVTQFASFYEYPLGIGVGNGKYKRMKSNEHITAASHNEVGRLIEEHGLIGFFLLLLLLLVPLLNFLQANNFQKAFIIMFYLMWFLTINHSAMRVALPGFLYALSLIRITNIENDIIDEG